MKGNSKYYPKEKNKQTRICFLYEKDVSHF